MPRWQHQHQALAASLLAQTASQICEYINHTATTLGKH
jgi:hypothetical protein